MEKDTPEERESLKADTEATALGRSKAVSKKDVEVISALNYSGTLEKMPETARGTAHGSTIMNSKKIKEQLALVQGLKANLQQLQN